MGAWRSCGLLFGLISGCAAAEVPVERAADRAGEDLGSFERPDQAGVSSQSVDAHPRAGDFAAPEDLAAPSDLAAPPDLACLPQTSPCDLVCQNCAAGQKCAPGGASQQCVASGTVADGQACGTHGTDDCSPGAVCVAVSTLTPRNRCLPFCRIDADCRNHGACVFQLSNGARLCSDPLTACDPVARTGCSGDACYAVTPDGRTGCHAAGGGAPGAGCSSEYDCAPGESCFGASGCLALCHAGSVGECGARICRAVSGWVTFGACG